MIHTILSVAAALVAIGVVGGAGIWFIVWVLRKAFHLDE